MGRLIYGALTSLDGYVADESGNFDWAAPGEEVHAFVNDLERSIGTYLYGRRMYEVMVYWADVPTEGDGNAVEQDYARIWQATDKIVYSKTLEAVSSERTTLERTFDPAAVRELKSSAERDISIGGAQLAGQAFAADLIDECHLFLSPVIVGGGHRALPDGVRADLELVEEGSFPGGVVHLHYRIRHKS